MKSKRFNPQDEREIRKIKRTNYLIFGVFSTIFILLAILFFIWFGLFQYWHTFTTEKWLEYPNRRAKMTADLLENYELVGMTEDEVISLLGQNNNEYGYFNQDNRFIYYLGEERTIIDSEWLLIDFENGVVKEYSMTMD